MQRRISRRDFLRQVALASTAAMVSPSFASELPAAEDGAKQGKPNIIYILADDLAARNPNGCYASIGG